MATHSSILAWKIPWTEEPGRLQSVGSQRVKTQVGTCTHTSRMGKVEEGEGQLAKQNGGGGCRTQVRELVAAAEGSKNAQRHWWVDGCAEVVHYLKPLHEAGSGAIL